MVDAMTTHDKSLPALSARVFQEKMAGTRPGIGEDPSDSGATPAPMVFPDPLPDLQTVTAGLIREAMHRTNYNQTLASRILGLSQPALSKRLKRLNQAV